MSDPDDTPQQDTIGMVSLGVGLLTWILCFGSCIPYLNMLTIFPSMFLSLVGTILGVIGIRIARSNQVEPGFSVSGLVINGIPLLIWICYWLFTFLMVFALFAMTFLVVLVDLAS